MEYKDGPGSIFEEIMADLEHAITETIVNSSGLYPNSRIGNTVVRIRSDPVDQVNSNCGGTCSIVEGRLALFLGFPKRRRSRLGNNESKNTLSTIESAMNGGSLSRYHQLDLSFIK